MSDTIETTAETTDESSVTPDPRAIAHAVLLEVADEPEQVGEFVQANELEDHVTDFRFAAHIRGYEGWQWSVTLYHDIELDSWTVNESSLIPTEDALLPPKWIPWKDRLEPTDLSPTDSIGTEPDDERLETGEVEESSVPDVNDAAETFRLTRRHVLSPLGRAQAAKRWYEGPRGPKALSTKTADGNLCSDCGFFVPLTGELDRMFGVCANKWSPDDGRVVSLDHGCGEHSEIEPPEPSHLWVQSKPALDDLHIDIVARPKARKTEEAAESGIDSDSESQSQTQSESQPESQSSDAEGESEPKVRAAESTAPVDEVSDAAAAQDGVAEADANVDNAADTDNGAADNDIVVDDVATEAVGAGASVESVDAVDGEQSDADAESDTDDDEATEEDIINNTAIDTGDDDFEDDDDAEVTEEVTPELETVIDLIEQLRQSRIDDSDSAVDADTDDSVITADTVDDSDDSGDESGVDSGSASEADSNSASGTVPDTDSETDSDAASETPSDASLDAVSEFASDTVSDTSLDTASDSPSGITADSVSNTVSETPSDNER